MMADRKKVVVSLLAKEQEFQALQAADATAAANRNGFDLEIVFAKNNSRLQIEQLYHYIHLSSKPVALVVQTVAGDGLPQVARAAATAGLGWVLLNRDVDYIDALQREHARLPIGAVTVDQVGIGRIQGQQIRKMLPRGGNALYIEGPVDTSAAWPAQRRRRYDRGNGDPSQIAQWRLVRGERGARGDALAGAFSDA